MQLVLVLNRLVHSASCSCWAVQPICLALIWFADFPLHADNRFDFQKHDDRVIVTYNDIKIGEYRFEDPNVSHPYWSSLHTRSGVQVTRNHPPHEGVDAVDHVGMHTGAWLAFGDVNGEDFWRLKSSVIQTQRNVLPIEESGAPSFQVKNEWRQREDGSVLLDETTRFRFRLVQDGYLIEWDSTLKSRSSDVIFGEQEEMGLGIRVAAPLAVDKGLGARMLDSAGRRNGKEIWGNMVEWCDYAGPIADQWCGVTVLVDSTSKRTFRCHARDYGFMALNPFSTKVFTGGEATPVRLAKGESIRLRFGLYVHQSQKEEEFSVLPAKKRFDEAAP